MFPFNIVTPTKIHNVAANSLDEYNYWCKGLSDIRNKFSSTSVKFGDYISAYSIHKLTEESGTSVQQNPMDLKVQKLISEKDLEIKNLKSNLASKESEVEILRAHIDASKKVIGKDEGI